MMKEGEFVGIDILLFDVKVFVSSVMLLDLTLDVTVKIEKKIDML